MDSVNNVYTFAEVSIHNSPEDCWVIINAKIYSVTNFLNGHPGGDEVLLTAAGKGASKEFEEAGHGSSARLMLDEFYIGETVLLTVPRKISTYTPPKRTDYKENKSQLFQFLVVLAVLGLAIGFRCDT